ncbi:MAG: hypothetical protein ABI323_02615 [Solirubrobacteraceae bacterium]
MTVVRCTAKLLKLLGDAPLTGSEPADDDWYANLLWIDGRKCLLMTQAATLFSLFEPEITKASVNPVGPLAAELVERELAAENLPPDTFGHLGASEVAVGRTSSRSVVGTMTEMGYQIEAAVHQSGSLRNVDLAQLNRSLRRIPFSAIKYERAIDRTRALLAGTKGIASLSAAEAAGASERIHDLLTRFLAERRMTLPPKEFRNYDAIIDFFRLHLNGYAYENLSPFERKRWESAVNAGDDGAYCRLFGPEKIPGEVGAFAGYFMISKVAAPRTVTAATGRVISDLLDWIVEHRLLVPGEVTDAKERAAAASSDIPRVEELASLLYELAERSNVDVQSLADADYVEDHLTISRVEAGALWFEGTDGELGPLQVGPVAGRIARPGWSVNLVMGRVRGSWHVVEVGNVYPD